MRDDAMPSEPTAPADPGARTRKDETQERIVRAAVALFATQGYERASISAIAARAEVSRSAVFWHFSNKESLFREAFRRILMPFFEELKRSLAHIEARKRVFEIFDVYERVVQEHRPAIVSIVRWLFESPALQASLRGTLFSLHDELMHDFHTAFEELAIAQPEAEALAAALLAMLDGNLLLSLLDPNPRNQERRSAGLRRFTERMLGAPDDE